MAKTPDNCPVADIYGQEFRNQVVTIVSEVLEKRGLTLAQIQEIKLAMHDALDVLITSHQIACSQRIFEKVYKLLSIAGIIFTLGSGMATLILNLVCAKYAPMIQKLVGTQTP